MFHNLLEIIDDLSSSDFGIATLEVRKYIDSCDLEAFFDILMQIGIIPESIELDSTQEKLFSKSSDAVLSRAFREIGLKSTVLKERADSADVLAESIFHGYTLVADAKAFRLSRTAKNQKDFKVTALSGWRNDSDYAVLCSPYFQYPTNTSQIYAQAVDNNVCLLSWEHLIFLIKHGIKETPSLNLRYLWNISDDYAEHCVVSKKKKNFVPIVDKAVQELGGNPFKDFLFECKDCISSRASEETDFWKNEIIRINNYTKEQAIEELIKTKKIDEKIAQIQKYVTGIKI